MHVYIRAVLGRKVQSSRDWIRCRQR